MDYTMQGSPAFNKLVEMLNSGTYGGVGKIRPWSWYDTAVVATGDTSVELYQNKVGQGGKTISDTNNQGSGQVPNSSHFTFDAIEVIVTPAAAVTHAQKRIIDLFYEEWRFILAFNEQSNELELPIAEILGNNNPLVVLGAGVGDQVQSRSPGRGIRYFGDVPVVMAALTTYQARIEGDAAANAALDTFRLKFLFKGYKLSPN